MKSLKCLLLSVVLALFISPPTFAQTAVTRTTLSSAVTAGAANNQVVVASATGISASTSSTQNYILVDRELMLVASLNGTTLTVRRGQSGTNPVGHKSGNQVFYGAGGTFNPNSGTSSGVFIGGGTASPNGTCTRTSQQFLPLFSIMTGFNNGFTYDCLGGQWVQGTLPDQPAAYPLILACNVPIGSVAYGSMGTSTTTANNVLYTASIYVPQTLVATGFSNLNGSAVDGASKKIFILYDSSGNLIANTAVAGTAATGSDAFQQIAFTAVKVLVGPARYLVSLQDDTADVNGIRTVAASTFNNLVTANPASTFGTVAATITAPTTFTADIGPIGCIY